MAPETEVLVDGNIRHSFRALDCIGYSRRRFFSGTAPKPSLPFWALHDSAPSWGRSASDAAGPELEYLADAEPIALIYDAELASEVPGPAQRPMARMCLGEDNDEFAVLATADGTERFRSVI